MFIQYKCFGKKPYEKYSKLREFYKTLFNVIGFQHNYTGCPGPPCTNVQDRSVLRNSKSGVLLTTFQKKQ